MTHRIQVFLNADLTLSWKPIGVKGARWHGGFRNIADICKQADAVFTDGRYQIEYVDFCS